MSSPLPFDIPEHLSITEEFIKVYMKHMTRLFQHDIVIVSVTDS